MNKYIDRDKLAEFARHSTIGIDANDIMRFPTADVVEVVRCKDCKYAIPSGEVYLCGGMTNPNFRTGADFCSYGERKETE